VIARRVIRRTTDLDNRMGPQQWTMDRSRWREVPAYRIEWPDGEATGTGLFASFDAAERYARGHGWMFDVEHEEECA
jgi:hypothetical protein